MLKSHILLFVACMLYLTQFNDDDFLSPPHSAEKQHRVILGRTACVCVSLGEIKPVNLLWLQWAHLFILLSQVKSLLHCWRELVLVRDESRRIFHWDGPHLNIPRGIYSSLEGWPISKLHAPFSNLNDMRNTSVLFFLPSTSALMTLL